MESPIMKQFFKYNIYLIAMIWIVSGLTVKCGQNENETNPLLLLPFVMKDSSSATPVTIVSVTGPENSEDAVLGTAPYFRNFNLILDDLKDDSKFSNRIELTDLAITDENEDVKETSTFRGVLLRDLLMDETYGAAFRPEDKGKDGRATAVIATGKDGKIAVFSFWELIKTAVGNEVIVAFEKNGSDISDGEGNFILVSGQDSPSDKRYLKQLSSIEVVNEWVDKDDLVDATTSSFAISGDVSIPTDVTTSSVSSLDPVSFSDVGPSFKQTYWRGTGVRLLDVIEQAVFTYPDEMNRCYVLLEAADKYRTVFSCGELAYTINGLGSGSKKHPGTLLVTSDFESADGDFSSDCTVDADQCHADDGATWEDSSNDFMTVISSEDTEPFGWPEDDARINLGGRHNSWITSLRVIYAE